MGILRNSGTAYRRDGRPVPYGSYAAASIFSIKILQLTAVASAGAWGAAGMGVVFWWMGLAVTGDCSQGQHCYCSVYCNML